MSEFILPEYLKEVYDNVLVHEMVHGFIFETIGKVKLDHGNEFKTKLKDIIKTGKFKFLHLKIPARAVIPFEMWKKSNRNKKSDTGLFGK